MQKHTCVWPGCWSRPEDNALPICDLHAGEVHAHMARRLGFTLPTSYGFRPPDTRNGVVYYLRVGDLVKVGFTSNLVTRLRSYPPDSVLLAAEPGTRGLESQRHHELRHSLVRGQEWFSPSPEVTALVAAVVAEHGAPRQRNARQAKQPVTVTRIGE